MARANYAMNLDKANNVRDLGGYPAANGKHTRWGQFLRGDNPSSLTQFDLEKLYRYGVRLQIDLRSEAECRSQPSALMNFKDIKYININMLDDFNSGTDGTGLPGDMADVYAKLLAYDGAKFASIMRKAISCPDDCVFINCTAGKDRTGVTAMLLLKIAGCGDDVIIADYAATYENIRREAELVGEKFLKSFEGCRDMESIREKINILLRSNPDTMERTLSFFEAKFISADGWMDSVGLSLNERNELRRKIIES